MRSIILVGTVTVLALAGLTACNENVSSNGRGRTPNPQTASVETPKPAQPPAITAKDSVSDSTSTKSLEVTATTKRYAEGAALADMFEVDSSKIALDRSKSPEIKKLAQDMIDAHTKTSDELKSKLVRAGLIVELPTVLDAMHKALLDELKSANAQDFDMRYLAQQKNAHNEALMLHQSYARNGDIADLKALANDTAPKIEQHMTMLNELENRIQARTAQNR
jgi:putative membrane protein